MEDRTSLPLASMDANLQIDELYEFSAPNFFDFLSIETEEQIQKDERWLETYGSHAPTPIMPQINERRSVLRSLCDFGDAQKDSEFVEAGNPIVIQDSNVKDDGKSHVDAGLKAADRKGSFEFASYAIPFENNIVCHEDMYTPHLLKFRFPVLVAAVAPASICNDDAQNFVESEAITPKVTTVRTSLKNQTAKKFASLMRNKSPKMKPKNHTPTHLPLVIKPRRSATKCFSSIPAKNAISTDDIAQKNQAIKKQKLDMGGSKKIHNVEIPQLVHKSATSQIELTQQKFISIDTPSKDKFKPLKLTKPRPPVLETALRARPTNIKSTQEMELEEFEKIPKFKATPLNKKIFARKGDTRLCSHLKSQITTPHEFHFATNDRLGLPHSTMMVGFFDKLSLQSDSSHHSQSKNLRLTLPNPFHLYTEERGLVKEKLLKLQIFQRQLEEEKAQIPKANPSPYTTNHPVMPPKPQPKQNTKPEIFHLDSLIRHEEEMQKKIEERERMEREEAERRMFRAQPILKEDPIPLPERERKALTEVQEFVLHVDHRAVERFEFNKKMKEKELTDRRLREEQEHAKMIEEEKNIKEMRRTMVPHARPVPNFDNPFHPEKSTKETTMPKSPHLLVNQRERKHHCLR